MNSPFVVLSYLKRGCQETCLNKFIEGNGIISVCVGFLYGPVGNASQLVIRNVYTNHHAQNLESTDTKLLITNRKQLLENVLALLCFPINMSR